MPIPILRSLDKLSIFPEIHRIAPKTALSIRVVVLIDSRIMENVSTYLRYLADNRSSDSLASYFRSKRARIFRDLISGLPKPIKILDVGGTEDFWIKTDLAEISGIHVTIANVSTELVSLSNFRAIRADGTNLVEFADGEFDVIFSNSVIEHVGSRERQVKMASEIQRVGRSYFVQTPARYFPIEPHFLFPFFTWLPLAARCWLVQNFNLGWFPKQTSLKEAQEFLSQFELLTANDMRRLFPSAKIIKERFIGLTKSYIAYSGFYK